MKTTGPDPTKVYESWSVGQDIVEKSAELGTTDDIDQEELNHRQDNAFKRIRGSTRDKDDFIKLSYSSGVQSFAGDDGAALQKKVGECGRRGRLHGFRDEGLGGQRFGCFFSVNVAEANEAVYRQDHPHDAGGRAGDSPAGDQ